MKINYVRAKNFLSIGEESVEIDFTKLGNIVNIKGHNLDSEVGASNASGKSSIIEIIVYGLYGKLIKGLNHKEAINIKAKRGLEVEVHWDNYRVLRKREPNRTFVWEGGKDISLGGIPANDDLIRSIIGLDHNSFINVSCFGQHNIRPFLCCGAEEKRQIAEQLLSLDKYLKYHKTAKDKTKVVREKMGQLTALYNAALTEVGSARKKQVVLSQQQKNWQESKNREIRTLESKAGEMRARINAAKARDDVKTYENAQAELAEVEAEVDRREKTRRDLHSLLEKAEAAIQQKKDERQDLALALSNHERELAILAGEIAAFQEAGEGAKARKGGTCPACYGEITEKNVILCLEHNIQMIRERQVRWHEASRRKAEAAQKVEAVEASLQKLLAARKMAREKETLNLDVLSNAVGRRKELSKVQKPDAASEAVLAGKDLQHVEERLGGARGELAGGGPYVQMEKMLDEELAAADSQSKVYKGDLRAVEGEMPYHEFWVRAFSDEGIRAFVIDEIIPSLNARINYWLQFLMEGRIQVKFDNELEETITRVPEDGDPFVYNSLSGGEHSRIDLAISQAFAHVMMITSLTCPSIVSLDEVGANIDRPGIQAIYKMICELSRDRQVLVITHDTDLLESLASYDTIEVVKKNGITTLKN